MNAKTLFLGAALSLAFTLPAFAQEADHSAHQMSAPAGGESASTQAFIDANAKMHKGMDIEFTGNADVDFVRGMIAHHQGAIDMAKSEVADGENADATALAAKIIGDQTAEIATMQELLATLR